MSTIDDDSARSYLEKILAILDIEAKVFEENVDENTTCFRIDCKADDARILIGRNGQTLESLQFIVRQMCRSGQSDQGPFIVDILDYRSRRKRTIEDQAKKGAVAVLNGDSEHYALPPMSPYERRIVHQYLQDNFADLASESDGMGIDRHIIISFKGLPADKTYIEDEQDDLADQSIDESALEQLSDRSN